MSIVWTILIGFVVGLVARAVKPGDDSAGFIVTTIIGIAGSLIVTYVGQSLGWYTAGQGAGFIASVLGAIVLLFIYGMIKRKSLTAVAKKDSKEAKPCQLARTASGDAPQSTRQASCVCGRAG